MTDQEPIEIQPTSGAGTKRLWAIGAGVLSVALVGSIAAGMAMAGGDSSSSDKVSTSNAVSGATEKSLKETAQAYYDAMVKGNAIGMTAYFPPECQDDAGMLMFGASMYKEMLAGITRFKITKVSVAGTRGEILDGEVEGKPSEATKRLFEDDKSGDEPDIWQFKNGKWYTTCDATFATASPSPAAGT